MRPVPADGRGRRENAGPGGGTAPGPHLSAGRDWDGGLWPHLSRSARPSRARHLGPLAPWGLRRRGWRDPAFRAGSSHDAEGPGGPAADGTREKDAALAAEPGGARLRRCCDEGRRARLRLCRLPGCADRRHTFFACQALLGRQAWPWVAGLLPLPFSAGPPGPRAMRRGPFGPRPLRPSTTARDLLRRCTIEGAGPRRSGPGEAWAAAAAARAPERKKARDSCRSAQKIPRFFSPPSCQGPSVV